MSPVLAISIHHLPCCLHIFPFLQTCLYYMTKVSQKFLECNLCVLFCPFALFWASRSQFLLHGELDFLLRKTRRPRFLFVYEVHERHSRACTLPGSTSALHPHQHQEDSPEMPDCPGWHRSLDPDQKTKPKPNHWFWTFWDQLEC